MRKVVRSTSAVLLALTPGAMGQVAQPQQPPANPQQASALPPQPVYEGHSLLRAGMARQGDPSMLTLREASFFAVPEPEPRIMRKHDLITIIVRQESESLHDGKTELTKEASLDASVDEWIRLNLSHLEVTGGGVEAPVPSISMDGTREFTGEGKASRRDRLVTRLTAEVIDIKPNETLVLQGISRVKSDDEEVEIVISGTCRIQDVSLDNTVLSTAMADFHLEKRTRGAVRDNTKRGFLPRLLDFINPF